MHGRLPSIHMLTWSWRLTLPIPPATSSLFTDVVTTYVFSHCMLVDRFCTCIAALGLFRLTYIYMCVCVWAGSDHYIIVLWINFIKWACCFLRSRLHKIVFDAGAFEFICVFSEKLGFLHCSVFVFHRTSYFNACLFQSDLNAHTDIFTEDFLILLKIFLSWVYS